MSNSFLALGVAAATLFSATSANAATLFSIAPDLTASQSGNCTYNTSCQFSDNYAAQLFTLDASSTVTNFGFNAFLFGGPFGTAVNYRVLTATALNTPGALITAGTVALANAAGPRGAQFRTTNYSFNVAPLSLTAGNYFLAFQNVTDNITDFLSQGVGSSGAFLSSDNGATFTPTYQGIPSVAISVGDTVAAAPVAGAVPEPATWAMMIAGFGLVGGAMRRRSTKIAFA